MVVTLNVENDAELRLHVKDLIKGQIASITREDRKLYSEIIQDVVAKKLQATMDYIASNIVKQVITDYINRDKDFFKNIVFPKVEKLLEEVVNSKDWEKLIDDRANKKITDLLKK